jgi:hypothetical protein
MSTLPVIVEILRTEKRPMSVREIVTKAGSNLPTRSRSPANVVHRDLCMDAKKEGSRIVRTSPGRYALREYID